MCRDRNLKGRVMDSGERLSTVNSSTNTRLLSVLFKKLPPLKFIDMHGQGNGINNVS